MIKIDSTIDEYLGDWYECSKCDYMCKLSNLTCYNDDTLLCNDCVEEEILYNWLNKEIGRCNSLLNSIK